MSAIHLREAKKSDLGGLLDLYRHLHHDERLPKAPGRVWKAILERPGLSCLVAVQGSTLIASCILIIAPNLSRAGRPYAVIENVVTHTDFRRRGIGRRLLSHAVGLARKAGCYKVMLMTGSKKQSVFRFYEKAGFLKGVKTAFVKRLGRV